MSACAKRAHRLERHELRIAGPGTDQIDLAALHAASRSRVASMRFSSGTHDPQLVPQPSFA